MIPRSGFYPIANKPQLPRFQGRHKPSNMALDLITPGDKVTLLDGKRQVVHTMDEEGDWSPVSAMRLEECKLYRVLEKKGHEGREVNGLKVPAHADDEDDSVDFLKLQELKDNGAEPTGKVRHLLYGTYLAPTETGEKNYFYIHKLDQAGKPTPISWRDGSFDDIHRLTEVKDGSHAFKDHNPFKLKSSES